MAGRKRKLAGHQGEDDPSDARLSIRVDKWLHHARFFKTRTLACTMIGKGHLRINAQKTRKPGHTVSPGDTLTFPMGDRIRVVRVVDIGERRGPASEAQTLYDDLDPVPDAVTDPDATPTALE